MESCIECPMYIKFKNRSKNKDRCQVFRSFDNDVCTEMEDMHTGKEVKQLKTRIKHLETFIHNTKK